MYQKRKSKIILISIILVIILILIAGVAYAYFVTDIFKDEKSLFFKYASQIGEEKEGFINSYISQYYDKKRTTPYEDNGTIRFNIESDAENIDKTNNCNITYNGKVDSVNYKALQDISINYSDEVSFPISYLKSKNKLGLKTQYVGSKYIAIETDQLSQFNESSSIALEQIPDIFDNNNSIKLTNEDITYIQNTYFGILEQELEDSNFSKVEGEKKGYKLSLSGVQFKNIIIKILETLQNDETTLNKINQVSISKIEKSNIKDMIKQIDNNSDLDNENIEVIVYQNKGKLKEIQINFNEGKISIEKIETGNSIQYNTKLDSDNTSIYLNIKYSGLQGLQTIMEDYELGISSEGNNYIYYWNHNVDFKETISIDEISSDNSLILTEQSQEQVFNLIGAIGERLVLVNDKHMSELGIPNSSNPLINLIPEIKLDYISGIEGFSDMTVFGEAEVNSYNTTFENYQGSNIKGVTVKGLITTIQRVNQQQDNKLVEINFNGDEYETSEDNLLLIKSEVEGEEIYKVEFEKNQNTGMIYRAVINKK